MLRLKVKKNFLRGEKGRKREKKNSKETSNIKRDKKNITWRD